jgi:hypothetical protein
MTLLDIFSGSEGASLTGFGSTSGPKHPFSLQDLSMASVHSCWNISRTRNEEAGK